MKKILFFLLAGVAAISANAQVTYNGAVAGQSYNFTTSISNSLTVTLDGTNPYTWSKTSGDADLSTSGALNTANVTIAIAGGATAGDQAVFSVVANTNTTPGCPSASQTLTVIVGNATFTATVAATQSVCQNDPAGAIAVTLSKTLGTITGFSYYIDSNNDQIRQAGETLQAGTVTSQIAGTINLTTTTAGIQHIIITSVTGNNGGPDIVSAQAYATAHQDVTIIELPVLNTISPL